MLVPNTEPSRGSTQHATPCGCRFRQQHKPVLFFGQRCWLSTLVAVLCTVVLPFSPLTHRTSQSRYTPALVTMSTVWIRQERESHAHDAYARVRHKTAHIPCIMPQTMTVGVCHAALPFALLWQTLGLNMSTAPCDAPDMHHLCSLSKIAASFL